MVFLNSCSTQKKLSRHINKYKWFPFECYADSVSGKYFDKLAITLPIKVNSLSENFTAQFDLGSNATSLYGKALESYFKDKQEIISLIDTTKKTGDGMDFSYRNKDFSISIGNSTIRDMWYMDKFGTAITPTTNKLKLAGTIGANFSKNKVLIIDYPNKRMSLLDTMDQFLASNVSFVDCEVKRNRIHIPVVHNGKIIVYYLTQEQVYFPFLRTKRLGQN